MRLVQLRADRKPKSIDPRFLIEPFEPCYLELYRRGELARRVELALNELADCCACPRNCHVNRLANETRVCHTGRYARVASAFAHFGEEDCLRGWNGSGTIFFSSCNLRCVFCQNWDISQVEVGKECNADKIADLMLYLQDHGCHNINFVTPEHVVPQVIEAIAAAIPRGLRVPIVYNTSAYDAVSSLRLLDGLIDIYMPDFKFWEPQTAKRLAKAPDYPQRAREAILEMHRQVGVLRFGPDGLARRGVLVRHLVMPGLVHESAKIFQWLAGEVSADTYVNIMGQYRPEYEVGEIARDGSIKYADINRRPTADEIEQAFQAARDAGLWRFDERW
ncbi:MAG: radical SAM protein [Pirellulaceae bacterium]|nr:MAG: radical SAM protein [Pirellulaceae bacterium]